MLIHSIKRPSYSTLVALLIAQNIIFGLALLFFVAMPGGDCKKPKPPKVETVTPLEKLDRNQLMLVNLNHGVGSPAFYILESMRHAGAASKMLERAAHQIEQGDASFAKSRHRPDDKFLDATVSKLMAASKSASDLETNIIDCHQQLKTDIQNAIVTAP